MKNSISLKPSICSCLLPFSYHCYKKKQTTPPTDYLEKSIECNVCFLSAYLECSLLEKCLSTQQTNTFHSVSYICQPDEDSLDVHCSSLSSLHGCKQTTSSEQSYGS